VKIIAVGNSFYGDDGVGTAVLDRIRQDEVFPGAELVDVHTDALALLDHLAVGEKNVVVDAAQMGLEPGGVEPERVEINQGLSEVVKEAVPQVISIIQAEVQSDG